MKIGIVTTWFERGAAYVSRQYRDVLAAKHEVYIYARGGESYAKGDPNWDNARVTWAVRVPGANLGVVDLEELQTWVSRNHLDVVFFNEQHWWPAVLACRRLGALVGTYVDYYTERTVPFFAVFDFLICNTKRHHSVFRWHPHCHFLPWGTETDVFNLNTPEAVEAGTVTFFHSGGISPARKGCDLVLQAFARIARPARLVVHVQRPLAAIFPHLNQLIRDLKSSQRLQIHEGTVPAPGLFHHGDVYVYPTRLEGIGLTIMEANACGLPVITTGSEPMTEFICHGINGRHVRVERYVSRADGYYWPQSIASIDDLCEQMTWYTHPSVSIPEEKIRARKYAAEQFDWRHNAKPLDSIFSTATRRSENGLQDVILAILKFERDRADFRELSKYQLLRRVIRRDHPKLWSALSQIRSRLSSSVAAAVRSEN